MKKVVLGLVVLAAFAAGAAVFLVMPEVARLSAPADRPEDISLDVVAGASQKVVIDQLGKLGVAGDPRVLYYYARWRKLGALKSGEYRIGKTQSPLQILDMMRRGEVVLHPLSFPEGLTYKEIAQRLDGTGMIKAEALIALCEDEAFLREHKVPGKTCEGYLFPDTYSIAKGKTPRDIAALFIDHFHEVYAKTVKPLESATSLKPAQIVTLASIIEKETAAEAERPRIASVFLNRLEKKIPLATDPTVIYAVTLARGSFDGNIHKADLQLDHPYNTYKRSGLPPGPISNPGQKALEAVVKPVRGNDLFFCSRNDGTHVFCPDLACHEAAVQKWQREYFAQKRNQRRKAP